MDRECSLRPPADLDVHWSLPRDQATWLVLATQASKERQLRDSAGISPDFAGHSVAGRRLGQLA
jgi:hypothetical protein